MIGKVNEDLFCEAILPCQGAKLPEVVVGPQMGWMPLSCVWVTSIW